MRHYTHIFVLLGMALVFCRCQGTEQKPLALKGSVKGTVLTYDARGDLLDDHSKVEVYLEKDLSNPIAVTNEQGNFIAEELTTGTYNFLFVKDGFDTSKVEGIPFLGGEAPVFVDSRIVMFHTATSIQRMDLKAVEDGIINLDLEIIYEVTGYPLAVAHIRFYLNDTPDVSSKNYSYTQLYGSIVEPGVVHKATVNLNLPNMGTGEIWYLIAYAAHSKNFTYRLIESEQEIFMGLGTPTAPIIILAP